MEFTLGPDSLLPFIVYSYMHQYKKNVKHNHAGGTLVVETCADCIDENHPALM